jgi:signal transduction histidine kinase
MGKLEKDGARRHPHLLPRADVQPDLLMERHLLVAYHERMTIEHFEEMKAYIGFDERDASNVRALGPVISDHFESVVDRFYDVIQRHPDARSVLTGDPDQIERLRTTLLAWLERLFEGRFDESYAVSRSAIGHTHVRVGLPQHYMFTAMEIVWQELESAARRCGVDDVDARLGSLHKALTLEIGLMLDSYKDDYEQQARNAERQTIARRLTRAEHLAEIGQLAASIAHEFKNPLAGISGAIQVLRDQIGSDHRQRPILEEILRQIARLDGAVKDLLIYARPPTPRPKPCRIDEIIQRILQLLAQEPSFEHVNIQYRPAKDDIAIEADEHQLEQLLMNLLLNAAHASTDGDCVRIRVFSDERQMTLMVEDEGQGMDIETLRRAREPFFTTKSRGTGLGLPICQRIVESHRGYLQIRSQAGAGTVVEVRLPLHAGDDLREEQPTEC